MRVSAAQFKAKMGRYMKAVRHGEDVVITDREEPVARVTAFRMDRSSRPTAAIDTPADPGAPPLGRVNVVGTRYRGRSTLDLLRIDRERR